MRSIDFRLLVGCFNGHVIMLARRSGLGKGEIQCTAVCDWLGAANAGSGQSDVPVPRMKIS